MAKIHKSQAEKAAANSQNARKQSASKNSKTNKSANKKNESLQPDIPVRLITSIVFISSFLVFLIAFFLPEGLITGFLYDLMHWLIGGVAYIVLIPILLYLFIIHAFSGKKPVIMRTVCLFSFVIICGCISHLISGSKITSTEGKFITELAIGGAEGTTGGLICGGLAMFMVLLFNKPISYIILTVSAILTFLAGIQITLPSIIRAIQNRPRPSVEDEVEEVQEPAAVVINHIVNKHIERVERRKRETEAQPVLSGENSTEDQPLKTDDPAVEDSNSRMNQISSQIDADVDEPVVAASEPVEALDGPEIFPVYPRKQKPIPIEMPAFDPDEPISDAPILETPPVESKPVETKKEKVTKKECEESAVQVAEEIAVAETVEKPEYCYPPINLLNAPAGVVGDGTSEMRENSRRLNETLDSFHIEARIINVTRGPSVTRYEVELEKGVRLSKLTTAADDIALSLGATGVRIAAVPGLRSIVGIEVPNRTVTPVSLREVIDSDEFNKARSKSSFAVGKDIGGACIIGNIAKLPHMLIAGTTGSGKSVCMNSIIISLLYKASPDEVKLIMIDPKMVELGIYNGIPHLLIPVVTDPKKAAGSLQWAVTEMMRRYATMRDAGVRDLESYNSIVETEDIGGAKLPQVVVIIDELADLMLVAAKEVEESICRIAQMGRAAGIHLVIATQRPSSDVITGLMKANIPSRIAFSVASAMESRIILDSQGAEKLVGKGDMLYAPIGAGKPKRVQGCFVSETEVEAVASYVKANFAAEYNQQVMEEIEKKAAQTGNKSISPEPEATSEEMGGDDMLPAAVDVILETGQASVSMLQRRLKLGYARAARIVDEMEEKGIVGPFVGSKPRTILITKEQWAAMKSKGTAQLDFDDLANPNNSEYE